MKYTGKLFTISAIIPCYGEPSIVKNSVLALAQQWIPYNPFFPNQEIVSFNLEILLVNDDVEHPDKYDELIDIANKVKTGDMVTVKIITNEKNTGQGLARQFGIDNCKGQFFVTCDEDDVYAPNALYRMWELLFKNYYDITKDEVILKKDCIDLAVISAPLYGFDVNDYRQNIPSRSIWVNSMLYNKKFLEANNVRYIEPTSRHAEDYTFIRMMDFAYNHAMDQQWGRIDFNENEPTFYYWYPNTNSQSRIDPYYTQRIAGCTMQGSCEIIKFMREFEKPEEYKLNYMEEEKQELLNMTVYSYFNILDFIKTVSTTNFIPTEEEWTALKNACNWLRMELSKVFKEIVPSDIVEQFYKVRHHSDCRFIEGWIDFKDYVLEGFNFFDMEYEEMMAAAHEMDFDNANHYKNASYVVEWRKNRGLLDDTE